MSDLSLSITRTVKAPIETVFQAWLDPAMLARFMIPGEGMSVPRAESDPKVGGRFTIIMATPEREIPHGGTYLRVEPHHALDFTWESPFSADGSTVFLRFSPTDGGTEISLTHEKFPDSESRDNHEGGWGRILDRLGAVLDG